VDSTETAVYEKVAADRDVSRLKDKCTEDTNPLPRETLMRIDESDNQTEANAEENDKRILEEPSKTAK